MTDDERTTINEFITALGQLRTYKNGIAPDYDFAELNPIAKQCFVVEGITAAGNTPEEILLHRLAKLTGDLITTLVLDGGGTVVREWLTARAELLQLGLSTP
jgi:hypothetical protein